VNATVVVRRIAATPARSAAEAWTVIAQLLAAAGSTARQELDQVAGIGMSLIAAEAMRDSSLVVSGVGSRLRLSCLYDEAAILGEGAREDPLPWCPTDGDWKMSFPCPVEDLPWVQAALASVSTRITARDMIEAAPSETPKSIRETSDGLGSVDVEAFLRS